MRQTLASRPENALEVCGNITPPNEHDDSDCARFIGHCLVELNEEQRCNERLQTIEQQTRGSSYDGPSFSSQNDKTAAIWEEIGQLKSKVDNIEDKTQDIENNLTSIEEKNEEQVDSLESRTISPESRVVSLEVKLDKIIFEQEACGLRQRNSLASRFYQPVRPVGLSYIDASGRLVVKVPTWPVKSIGYYWKMHNKENHKRLIDMHSFYQLDFRHWALTDDEGSDNSYEPDNFDLPFTTLERAGLCIRIGL